MKASVIAFDNDNNDANKRDNNIEKKYENNDFPLSDERKSNVPKEQSYKNYKILKDENETFGLSNWASPPLNNPPEYSYKYISFIVFSQLV